MRAGRPRLPDDRARDKATAVRLEAALVEQADELAARMDVSRSWVIRRALIEFLEREAGSE